MARLISGSGYDRALIGGFVASESTRQRKERDRQDFRDSISRQRGSDYLDRYDDRSRALDVETLARRALAINRHSRSSFRDDMIMDMYDIGELQHTPLVMQDYLLADRTINYLARNQRIEALGRSRDDYARDSEDDARHNHHYRAMNNGMMRTSENDDADMYTENFLGIEDDRDTPKLSYDEQRSLYLSRDRILAIFNEGNEDPTSPSNNLL